MPHSTNKKTNNEVIKPTLSNINYFGRIVLRYTVIFLVVLMVGRVFWNVLSDYWIKIHPPAPPPPTVGFGILPNLTFPNQSDADKPKEYVLELAGGLSDDVDRAPVFLIPKPVASLLADQKVKEIAATYGFIFTPKII